MSLRIERLLKAALSRNPPIIYLSATQDWKREKSGLAVRINTEAVFLPLTEAFLPLTAGYRMLLTLVLI